MSSIGIGGVLIDSRDTVRWLEGRAVAVLYASTETGYRVLKVETEAGVVTVVGGLPDFPSSLEGKTSGYMAFEGVYRRHPVHGMQFRASGFVSSGPTTLRGLELFLGASGVKGVGPKVAKKIVSYFGEEVFSVLECEPKRLTEVPGVGTAKSSLICQAWAGDKKDRVISMKLRGLGLGARVIQKIIAVYGEKSLQVIHNRPYSMVDEISGVGFKTADDLAQKLGLAPNDPARVSAAARAALVHSERDGHCYLRFSELRRRVLGLDVPVQELSEVVHAGGLVGRFVVEGVDEQARVYRTIRHVEECEVADMISSLAMRGGGAGSASEVERAVRYAQMSLEPEQIEAVRVGLSKGISVITGGPGTGKTTLIRVLLRAAVERGESWSLASPTGRAAKRLQESTGADASTIHRLLEFNPGKGGFQRGFDNPLDGDGLVVDEVSMLDLSLARALLFSIPTDRPFTLVFVGDADQLPSVGAGAVLADVIASGAVPVARLTSVHRQAAQSGILVAAQQILSGVVPASGEHTGHEDLYMISRPDGTRGFETILEVVSRRLPAKGFDPLRDVVVLTPMHKGDLGVDALNSGLQELLNPDGAVVAQVNGSLRVGDRVMCTKNRADLEVYNGDLGLVLSADQNVVEIDFGDQVVEWERDDLNGICLAYAITIHKSQGSEYPAVVLALHSSHHIMLRRQLFYTAVTRAKQFMVVVGDDPSWQRSVRNTSDAHRNTALAQRIVASHHQFVE